MTYTVHLSSLAEDDVQIIVGWIRRRSPKGAQAWLDAFDGMLEGLSTFVGHAVAPEGKYVSFNVQQVFFKTRFGNDYRALYTVEGDDVIILRVRAKGQPRVKSNELQS